MAYWHCKIFSEVYCNKDLSNTDRILLPHSILNDINKSDKINYNKQIFQIDNLNSNHPKQLITTCLEFYDDFNNTNIAYVPTWLVDNLWPIKNSDIVQITLLPENDIQNGSYLKIRPHNHSLTENDYFLNILETALSNYSCLNKNSTILIKCYDEVYPIDIIDLKPADNVYIVNCDIKIDIDQSVDYVENINPPQDDNKQNPKLEDNSKTEDDYIPFSSCISSNNINSTDRKKFKAYSGTGYVLSTGKRIINENKDLFDNEYKAQSDDVDILSSDTIDNTNINQQKLKAFSGTGHKLGTRKKNQNS